MPESPTAVLVDAYATGNFLPRAFADLGVDVVHVQGTEELIGGILPPALAAYRDTLICAGADGFTRVADQLAELAPVAVLAGQEPGVPLADALSERLGLASNGTRLSAARRNKYAMIEALRAAGLHCAQQVKASTAAALVQWAEQLDEYPVVVKPLSSASTDNVHICRDADQVAAAATAVLTSVDIFGGRNTEVLAQTFLHGTEYIVDSVSVDGSRYICGVWQYRKHLTAGGRKIYDQDILLAPTADPVPELIAYLDNVLKALDIHHGPAHAEIIVTPDGPALVEIGARINGNMHPAFHDTCLGTNQADLTALAYARPAEFVNRYAGGVYTVRQPAVVHSTATSLDGVISSIDDTALAQIAALPSVHAVEAKLRPGSRLRPTVDLLSSPLRIYLTASTPTEIDRDYQAIQHLKDRVYRLDNHNTAHQLMV